MSRDGMTSFLSLNRSLTNLGGGMRQFQLPRMNPFPKLDGRVVRSVVGSGETRAVSRPVARGSVIIDGAGGSLPEMASDLIDVSANYAVENVKRDRSSRSSWSRVGLGRLVGQMLGGHRAARM
jgi:hypothetical protein